MRSTRIVAIAALVFAMSTLLAQAAPLTLGPTSLVSGLSPFAPGCGGRGRPCPAACFIRMPRSRRTSR